MSTVPKHVEPGRDGRAIPFPGVEPQRRRPVYRLTIETDADWLVISNDRHAEPGFTLTIKSDARRMNLTFNGD
jgi:hypothetical protein